MIKEKKGVRHKLQAIGGNVGEMMAVALASAGKSALLLGGRYVCETDYLAASGAVFPSVEIEALEDFNRRTMYEDMTEELEMRRYVAIASFFGRKKS